MITEEGRKRMGEARINRVDPNGNHSPYTNQKELRKKRIEVFKISNGKCVICGEPAKLVHHIDRDKSNHSFINLIALCRYCHRALHSKKNI